MTEYIHGNNLAQKESAAGKYIDALSRQYLAEIRAMYDKWRDDNGKLIGPLSASSKDDPTILAERVASLIKYKDFVDQQHYAEHFDSRSNLHSSIIEEFIYYLFKDLVAEISIHALIGKARTFKDIMFKPSNFQQMVSKPHHQIELKDHDFVIGVRILGLLKTDGSSNTEKTEFQIPAVAIECKTYLDKTMLEGSSTAAEQLKNRNPDALYIIASEWLKLTEAVNLAKYKVDQIYILRKQKNTDREFRYADSYMKNPIHLDVV